MDIQNRYNNLCRSIENECVDEEEYGKRITEQEILAESSRIEQEIKINEYEYENQDQYNTHLRSNERTFKNDEGGSISSSARKKQLYEPQNRYFTERSKQISKKLLNLLKN